MRVLFLVAALMSAGVAVGEDVEHELLIVQPYQEESVKISVRGYVGESENENSDSLILLIPGILSVEGEQVEIKVPPGGNPNSRTFPDRLSMIAYVKDTFCHDDYRPRGEIYFKAKYHADIQLPMPEGDLSHLNKSFKIRVSYGAGNIDILQTLDVDCQF